MLICRKYRHRHFFSELRVVLIAMLLVLLGSNCFAQMSVSIKSVKLETAVKQITSHSNYQFFYNDNMSSMPVNAVKVKKVNINQLLDRLFEGKNILYKVVGKVIYLSQKEVAKPSTTPQEQRMFTVTGRVTDAQGNPLQGVSIQVRGTTKGTVTDAEGRYVVVSEIPHPRLVYSYVGYRTKEASTLFHSGLVNVVLNEESRLINEVVVTALGIKRSQKALSYNVQKLDNEEFTDNKDANFINSLAGKVAGVTINASSSGIGGACKVVMRGAKAIQQSSNALYVIDGIPMFNLNDVGETEFSSKGATEAIADINPEDIESLSVLTGGAAAALYGSSAANGAIVITTKKGTSGKTELTITQNTDFLNAFVLPKFQNKYGTGSRLNTGTLDKSWGSLLSGSQNRGYSPSKDYLRTGVVASEGISLSTGNQKNKTYLSANMLNSAGIIPNNDYNRYNITFRNTTSLLDDKMQLDLGAMYVKQNDLNMVNQGIYSNPLVSAYLFPRGDDWNQIKHYERYDEQRGISIQYWPQELNEFTGQNPYWINYRNLRQNKRDRYILNAGLNYQVNNWFNLTGRVQMDNENNDYDIRLYASSNTTLTEGSSKGYYGINATKNRQFYGDMMANINHQLTSDLSLQANVGVSLSNVTQDILEVRGPIREDLISNKFDIYQLDNNLIKKTQSGYHDQTKSLFANVELGYKGAYYLTLTGRNDWPSQLAGTYSQRHSFFYSSVGTSLILSNIFHLPKAVNFLKLRASYASIGLPFPRFLANSTYEWDSALQQWTTKSNYPLSDLKPEKTNTFEVGLMASLWNHINFDLTLYHARTYNQTFDPSISVSSAYSTLYVQTGSVRNQGIELAVGYKGKWGDWGLSSNYIFSANRNKILELVRDYVHPETGAIINKNKLDVGGLSQAHFILKEGGTLGDLYSLSDLQRTSDGTIYVDAAGRVYTDNSVNAINLGSVFPKSNMSWQNKISWKNFSLDFMLAARFGGIAYSATQAAMDDYGVSEETAIARDRGYVLVNGQDKIDPEVWYSTIGGKSGIPQFYTYSATNIRLQEARIGYTFSKDKLWGIAELSLSLVGRNLWMIYCKAPFDPELVATTGNYYPGIDNFMTPNTRNIGFAMKLKF